ncbi:MAG TPA: MFS transporter [Thermoanaerobaculia bacterium]|nr:MFS transporter [Thermoanaerobaculia bacterium]HQR66384.1 MFS transporter [Thermoanaerobaculia bacterium]
MPRERLFTPRYFLMCGFTFTVFLSAFQVFPTAPYRILDLGGDKFAAGLFLGLQTWASALSAPFTGALGDRIGRRKMLVTASLVGALFSGLYAVAPSWPALVVLVFVYGIFWSGLLSASSAYMTAQIPASRRAEGFGYWGMATMLAVAFAPGLGLALYRRGWAWVCGLAVLLNLVMAGIASSLPETHVAPSERPRRLRDLVEWRVLGMASSLFLTSFGYGAAVSFAALWTEQNGVAPRGLWFSTFALVVLVTRLFSGRLADRVGSRKLLLPAFVVGGVALFLLGSATTRPALVVSAALYGLGFGNAYTFFVAHVFRFVRPERRGAAFGSAIAAFDTGIGTGSMLLGALAERSGFGAAFHVGGALALLAPAAFLVAERRLLAGEPAVEPAASRA